MRISLVVGESKTVTVGGGRFYYEAGAGAITVKTVGNDAAEFDLMPGMGFQNNPDQQNFFAVQIINKAGVNQDIDFIISYREVFDNRVSFDDIPVDNFLPLKERTSAFLAFMKSRFSGSGGVGTFACVALRNPLGSTRNCWVGKIIIGSPSIARVFVRGVADMAAAELNAAVSMLNQGGDTTSGKKRSYGPGGGSQSVTDSFMCNNVSFAGVPIFESYCNAGSLVIDLEEPILLIPGNGIWVTNFDDNAALAVSFEIVEEVI
jgi:hypothetical protein